MEYSEVFNKILSHSKEHGFIFQSSEIYGGLSACYDYGPLGVEMKKNLANLWWKEMVQMHKNIVGIDASIFMDSKVWEASGHIDAFSDPMIDNKDSKKRYRADVLLEEEIVKIENKIKKEIEKAKKRFGESFNEIQFITTNEKVKSYHNAIESINFKMKHALDINDMSALKELIEDLKIVCPDSGTRNWTEVRQFNLMFSTQMSFTDDSNKLYLRPETAQGIFVNFLNVQKSSRMKVPFGIAQIGKSFRNEITGKQFIFRMREFEQMEMQFFIKPGTQKEWFDYWQKSRYEFHIKYGLNPDKLKYKPHLKLAFYADAATDIEFEFPFGFKEMEGIHSRTDYDLKQHIEHSGKKLQYFDPETNESYIPYVIETSVGLDRLFLAHYSNAYCEEYAPTADGGQELRTVLKLHKDIAPIKIAILPLVKKDGMPEMSESIANILRPYYKLITDDKDAIGRRYRRMDTKGTPYCITVDNLTLEDQTVTIRERDTMIQERVQISDLKRYFYEKFN